MSSNSKGELSSAFGTSVLTDGVSGIYEMFKLFSINAGDPVFSVAFSLPRNVLDDCRISKYNCKTRWLFFKLRTLSYILVLVIH